MNSSILYASFKKLLLPFCLFISSISLYISANAQEQPPKPIEVAVSTAQYLNFGTIIPTSIIGGSVTVGFDNSVLASGDVLLLHSYNCRPALFIVDAEPGVLINIVYEANTTLKKGGYSMLLLLDEPHIDSQVGRQFITTKKTTNVYIGGKLTVGSITDNPSGIYDGEVRITFNQQ